MPCASQVRAVQPAALLEIVERPAAVYLLAELVLVLGLGQMGVQADIELVCKLGGRAHQRGRHRKRRAWRQRDLHHGVLAALVMFCHHARAVGQNRVLVLHHAVGRQAAVALRAVHRATRQQHAHAEPLRHRDLDIDGVLEPGRKDVMMIGGRGASRQQQFRHRHADTEVKRFRRQPRPHRIERLQPRKQFAVERRRQRPRQGLVEMVMGVDQPRKHDMRAGVIDGRHCRSPVVGRAHTRSTILPSCTTTPRSAPSARIARGSLIQIGCACSMIPPSSERRAVTMASPCKDRPNPGDNWRRTCKTS